MNQSPEAWEPLPTSPPKAMYRGIQHPELNIMPYLSVIHNMREQGKTDEEIARVLGWEVEEMRAHLTAWDDCDG